MKEDYIYLNYYQAITLLLKLKEIKDSNPYFNDNLVNSFSDYFLQRTYEIAFTTPLIKLKLFPNYSKYKISKSLFNYLTRLTSINVFDEETLITYTMIINELENALANELIEECKKDKIKKIHKF